MRIILAIVAALAALPVCCIGGDMEIPTDFPRFDVPGRADEMHTLRELYWLHYPGSGPKSTMWDMWLAPPSLWPATDTSANMRRAWNDTLSGRTIDPEGYVATHQHPSIAHPLGWPFPFWNQGAGGVGWHFSFKDTVGPPWRQQNLSTTEGWQTGGAQDKGIGEYGWQLDLTSPHASITAPAHDIDVFQSPFVQLRWRAKGLGDARPYIEWTTSDKPQFSAMRRMYFDPVEGDTITYSVIPLYKHPGWHGTVTQFRVNFGNAAAGASVTVHSIFTQYDTRHNINSQSFIHACTAYFHWTRDINFLRRNIDRMRTALRYVMTEHQAAERKVVYTDWVGHDGRSGLKIDADGKKHILYGHGIGNNYWDLLPFGNLDCYATMIYYAAVLDMAQMEREIREHPEWNIPEGVFSFDPDELTAHAADVKKTGNRLFWNPETGRFVPGIDADGKIHDYGCTFLNLEAVYYDYATPEHAKSILSWINGDRAIEGDTSQGADIYHWRFAPRATTKRNVEYYFWGWNAPESIPFGAQIQDGGAVLGWSYHDLMARLKVLGSDNAAARLQEIVKWFDEVQAAGGYRKYYDGSREGTLQGGGTAGGLGMDSEFFESVLVPQVMLDGFMGFEPAADGFAINPNLPSDWPELSIDRVKWQGLTLRLRATHDVIEVLKDGESEDPCWIALPPGDYRLYYIMLDGDVRPLKNIELRPTDGAVRVDWHDASGLRIEHAH